MIEGGIQAFAGARVLLLQGPVGPFFARLARDLTRAGADVETIAFNAGDWLFRPPADIAPTTVYRGTMETWAPWLAAHMAARSIGTVLLYGDCRPIHVAARDVASTMGIAVGVFEEGYLRPDFITLERGGANDNSTLSRSPAYYRDGALREFAVRPVPRSFWPMVLWGFVYFVSSGLAKPWFRHYRHHRRISAREFLPWLVLSPLRKAWFAVVERGLSARMTGEWSGRFFLVPLQVHNDAQIHFHADVGGVEGFVADTIASFARAAPADAVLVLKHHPMDRAYRDYSRAIRRAAQAAGCADRVVACHDQHMPTILPHCRGVVVVNSTTGLAAIASGRPTKVLGRAIYDMPGMTFQGSLDQFWTQAPWFPPDGDLYERFRAELITRTQINGNFYRRLDASASATGIIWPVTSSSSAGLAAAPPDRARP